MQLFKSYVKDLRPKRKLLAFHVGLKSKRSLVHYGLSTCPQLWQSKNPLTVGFHIKRIFLLLQLPGKARPRLIKDHTERHNHSETTRTGCLLQKKNKQKIKDPWGAIFICLSTWLKKTIAIKYRENYINYFLHNIRRAKPCEISIFPTVLLELQCGPHKMDEKCIKKFRWLK